MICLRLSKEKRVNRTIGSPPGYKYLNTRISSENLKQRIRQFWTKWVYLIPMHKCILRCGKVIFCKAITLKEM